MKACVILYNMIIEDERDNNLNFFLDNVGHLVKPERNPERIQAFLETHRLIKNKGTHTQLNFDLTEQWWKIVSHLLKKIMCGLKNSIPF
jgi:hypothetical protein